MGELATAAQVKAALRIPAAATIWDVRIGEIIDEVEDQLLDDLGHDSFAATTYTETVDTWPGGQSGFLLSRFPVRSIVAITLSSSLLSADQYAWKRWGEVRLVGQGLLTPCTRAAVQATYTAGVVAVAGTTPSHLRQLVVLRSARQFNQEPLAGYAETAIRSMERFRLSGADIAAIDQEIDRIWARYVRQPIS